MKKENKNIKTKKNYHKFELYEAAVQDPEGEIEIIDQFFRENFDHEAQVFREDFCSTFLNACQWVKIAQDHHSIAVDLDPRALAYGKKHHASKLNSEEQNRVSTFQANVMNVVAPSSDIISISNFSIGFLRNRKELLEYFSKCYRDLSQEGMIVFDLLGGFEVSHTQKEKRKVTLSDGTKVNYIWEHAQFNPINREAVFHIHFSWGKGQEKKKAFSYHWRMWTIPEISDVLREAGFQDVKVYWENDDEDGEGNGTFSAKKKVEDCAIWIVYVAGLKKT